MSAEFMGADNKGRFAGASMTIFISARTEAAAFAVPGPLAAHFPRPVNGI